MCAIKDLKERRKRTDEDTILETAGIQQDETNTSKDYDIFSYATDAGYVKKSHYGSHNTYNITSELIDGKECSHCGEKIITFICQDYNINLFPKYVNIESFEQLANEVNDLKRLFNDNILIAGNRESHSHEIIALENSQLLLKQQVDGLKRELSCRDDTITLLKDQLVNANNTVNQVLQENVQNNRCNHSQPNPWENVNKKNFIPRIYNKQRDSIKEIPLRNRFEGLIIQDDNDLIYNDDVNTITNSFGNSCGNNFSGVHAGESVNFKKSSRPQIVTQNVPENNIEHRPNTIPGNSSYANVTRNGKKTLLIGASIVRSINIYEFNRHLETGNAIKRSYGGSTTTDLHWHITPSLIDEKPDVVVLNIGTNNLTKKRQQTEEEICQDIFKIADKCRSHGVNEIFISSLTIRPSFGPKVDKINDILRRNADKHKYSYIDNSNITREHLARDGLHLNREGTTLLAKNFLFYLNSMSACANLY